MHHANPKITDEGIKHMQLHHIDINIKYNSNITNNGINMHEYFRCIYDLILK